LVELKWECDPVRHPFKFISHEVKKQYGDM
jgi:hypothetical protein